MEKFVFYDYETTGISPEYDQPLQFAAIITDLDFNEIERVDIRCQLSPHILPAPMALYVTGVNPNQLLNNNLPTAFEFAQKIQEFTQKWAPAIWIGYNTIKFDENVMRQMFYQNLQPNIFATQFFENSRLDVMKIVFAIFAENPDILEWPTNEKGKINFKLDQLAPANGFKSHNAHDALGDVEATIFILNIIKTKAPELYKQLIEARNKSYNLRLLSSFKPVEVTFRFGGNLPKTYTGCLCSIPSNNNRVGFFDLDQSNPMDVILGGNELIEAAMQKSPQRIRNFAINQADTIRPAKNTNDEWDHICSVIEENIDFRTTVSECIIDRYASDEGDKEKTIEQKIYDGFYSNEDKSILEQFQLAPWEERLNLLSRFSDERLIQLGRRLIAFNAPKLLTEKEHDAFDAYLKHKWESEDDQSEWTTTIKIKQQLEKLEEHGCETSLLNDLKDFYKDRLAEKKCLIVFE
ncbi:exonuclease domain-containing protein [Amylibacter sp.]|nr:exonuclease domain-containing protein [Amylibacter sp.]